MNVLIIGGYGVVGRQIAALLAHRHPQLTLTLAGRSLPAAQAAAQELPGAQAACIDIASANPLRGLTAPVDVIVAAVNDDDDHLLLAAAARGLPLIDITRWTERVQTGAARLLALPQPSVLSAPIVFASSWMAGLAATLAREAALTLATVERIDIDILYALKDRSGPNSVAYMDRLATPFRVMEEGRQVWASPLSDPRDVAFADGPTARTARFDAPDQFTLPTLTGARNVATRIAFDDPWSSWALRAAVRSGLWRLLSRPSLAGLRHALLHNPGPGGPHRIEVSVSGQDAAGGRVHSVLSLADPQGQTHLTAVGAMIQVERVLGLNGHARAPAGLQVAEALTDGALVRQTLQEEGIQLTTTGRCAWATMAFPLTPELRDPHAPPSQQDATARSTLLATGGAPPFCDDDVGLAGPA